MKVKYKVSNKTLEIKDDSNWQLLLIKGILILNSIIATLWLFKNNGLSDDFTFGIVWIFICIISVGFLLYSLLKISVVSILNVQSVLEVSKGNNPIHMRYSFTLYNGKVRYLYGAITDSEEIQLHRFISEVRKVKRQITL